jgi:hypothetical protein
MRRRILAATAVFTAGILAACSDNSLPTAPVSGPSLKATINADGCVDPRLQLALVDPEVKGLITYLFKDLNQASSTQSMWENMKKDKLDGKPLLNHIDNLTKWTLEHLASGALQDPDGATGVLNATTGSVRLLDLVFRCAGQTPTSVPSVPAGFDAIFKLVAPSTSDQQFNTSFNDAAAFIPGDALDGGALLVLARQPDDVNVNTPFPKVSRTVDVALAGGKIKPGQNLSVLFCPLESVDEERNPRLVVAHQKTAVAPGAPVGDGVEYLPPNQGGSLDCPHGVAAAPQMERNGLKRSVMHLASFAGKAWSLVGPKSAWAAHAAIGGLISFDAGDEGSLSPMVLVDPFVETGITDVTIPTTTYGEAIAFSATLRVTNVPASCVGAGVPAVCGWIGQPVTAALPGMPALTLANLKVAATLDGQTLEDAIDPAGKADFSFTHINAGDNQTASLAFAHTINHPANAPDFAPSTATAPYTVNRRPLTVTADASEWEYGTPETVTGTFSAGAVQYSENVTPSYTTAENAMTEVGTYADALVADVVFGPGSLASNYIVTKTNATLTVVKAPLSVTADDKSRLYGAADPAFTATVVGIRNSDTYTLGFTTTADAMSEVSGPTYPITPTITGDRLARNYDITLANGALTITPAPLNVVIDNASRQYGDPDPAFTTQSFASQVRNSDVLTVAFSTTATVLSPVGPYVINGTVNGTRVGNYAVTVTPGMLSVTLRAVTVTVDNASRDENTPNPVFTGTLGGGGLVAGDGVAVAYATTALTASAAGPYPITASLTGLASANYNPTITPGTLTVVAVAPVLDINNDFPAVSTTLSCGEAGNLFQSFTPSTSSLRAAELRFRAGGDFPVSGAVTLTINIRSGSPIGSIVATATGSVSGLTVGQDALVNFTLPTPLSVNANGVYVIEWVGTPATIVSLAVTDADTYAGGTAFGCTGIPIASQDYYFKTYR